MTDQIDYEALAAQLRKPTGDFGQIVANNMHQNNANMTLTCINQLDIHANQHVLELGHASALHLKTLFDKHPSITYYGLEISELMHEQAQQLASQLTTTHPLHFKLYDGKTLPYPNTTFNRIFTVNTLYFWENPLSLLNELHRVLKPEGVLCICFGWKSFMENMPFTSYNFKLYDANDIDSLVKQSTFGDYDIINCDETFMHSSGEEVHRDFAVLKLKKN